MNYRRAALYLQIPAAYCRPFGGLRWAQRGEAVEFLDGPDAGQTFAFAVEIGQFLEGVLAQGEWCPAFGTVLHLLLMLGLADRAASTGRVAVLREDRLARPFRELGSPLRNAGALCSRLLHDVPTSLGVADPPELADLLELLNGGSWIPQIVLSHPMLGAMDYAEQPVVDASALEAIVSSRLEGFSDEVIHHWLKFGRGPVGDGGEIPIPPRGLVGATPQVEERPRLTGLTRLISRLEGALSLPPRRLDHDGPETAGYWDLTTRGSPEQILPIQFALEDAEFLRRFAEHELLYFHREAPIRPAAQELVLLLDQGVRTWGDIRLVLAAAAMALARQATRRKLAVRLTTTGNGSEPVDPAELTPDALGELLEGSDLMPNPARTLVDVLRSSSGTLRDVVLLTHPRSLDEPDVVTAARRPAADDATRIFSIVVDGGGEIELAELKGGRPVPLSRCRVDLSDGTSAEPSSRKTQGGPRGAWRGEVEPIPFPFRYGLLGPVAVSDARGCRFIDFDEAGRRILVALRYGLPCTYRVDGDDAEVLPRPIIDGQVMRPITAVIGVAGGFILVGSRKQGPLLAHYDFPTRTCNLHALDRVESTTAWFYYADLHTLVGRPATEGSPPLAIDLAETGAAATRTWRAKQGAERERVGASPKSLPAAVSVMHSVWSDWIDHVVALDTQTGALWLRRRSQEGRPVTPMSDGRPALAGARIGQAWQGGDVLAVQVEPGSAPDLWFVSMSRSAVIGSFSSGLDASARSWVTLSRDGRRFARRVGPDQIEIRDVPGDRPPLMVVQRERMWIHFASLGRHCLLIREFDQFGARRPNAHVLVRWDVERLTVERSDAVRTFHQLGGVIAESRSLSPESLPSQYDRVRFNQIIEQDHLRILIDQYNHLVVLGREDRLIAMFYLAGSDFAAWLPDGTCLGSYLRTGGESKAAAERIAATLRAAERGERGGR
jgi:hypothetical protein